MNRSAAGLTIALMLAACGNPSALPSQSTVPAQSQTSPQSLVATQAAWLARKTLRDGAILYTGTEIEPYYANVAAIGETAVRSKLGSVRAWMTWYVAHLNVRDKWGLRDTMYDYAYDPKTHKETATGTADSVDSYAATFFTLARALYDTGDGPSQRYVRAIRRPLEDMAAMLNDVTQPDGMTIALPDYPVAFLMDNCEVYRGASDLSYLEANAFGDESKAATYAKYASHVAAGIATLWSKPRQTYDEEKQEPLGPVTPARWQTWYPDATAQLFPALQGVVAPNSARATFLWQRFNRAWPGWERLQFPDQFPWALVGATAAVMGDSARVQTYTASVQRRFAPKYPWPWYDLEAGWFMRMLSYPQTFTIAE